MILRVSRFLTAIAALSGALGAAAQEFREGIDYFKLPVPVETRDSAKIEVVEVFSYGCVHCYRLEPSLNAWLATQSDDVDFYRVPMATRNMRTLAQAFYAAKAMEVLPKVHLPLFENIHEYGLDMSRPQYIRRMFVDEADVEEEEFMRVFESFAVNTRVRQADAQTRMYRVQGTPSMIVEGRYLVDTVAAGGNEAMLLVVNQLVDRERAARQQRQQKAGEEQATDASAPAE